MVCAPRLTGIVKGALFLRAAAAADCASHPAPRRICRREGTHLDVPAPGMTRQIVDPRRSGGRLDIGGGGGGHGGGERGPDRPHRFEDRGGCGLARRRKDCRPCPPRPPMHWGRWAAADHRRSSTAPRRCTRHDRGDDVIGLGIVGSVESGPSASAPGPSTGLSAVKTGHWRTPRPPWAWASSSSPESAATETGTRAMSGSATSGFGRGTGTLAIRTLAGSA